MNQRTSSYFKYIYIEFTTMCDVIMNKKNKIFKENRLLLCSSSLQSQCRFRLIFPLYGHGTGIS